MKRSWKVASGCRLTLVFVLLLAAAAWTVSISAAEEPAGQKSEQTVVKPVPAAPVPHLIAAVTQLEQKPQGVVQEPAQKTEKPVAAKALQAGACAVQARAAAGQKPGQTVEKPTPAAPVPHPVAAVTQLEPKPDGVVQEPAQKAEKPVAAKALQTGASAVQARAAAAHVQAAPALRAKSLPALLRQTVAAADKKPETEAKKASLQLSPIVKETIELLASPRFTFLPDKALDPFVPFVSLQPSTGNEAPQASGPLTPLQKMTLAEMAKGLKAIAWGALGRMAVIQDSTGKGYIVGVGTPAGPNGGVITQISSNCLVIQQEVWNSQTRKRVPENFTVKMVKKGNESL